MAVPDAVLGGIKAGAIEIHQRSIYNSGQRTLEQLAFVVPATSPVPFPNPGAAPVADHYMIQVESASTSNSPRPSVILAGHAISNDSPTPWGDITGAGVILTFGYTTAGGSVQFGPILESVSPLYGLYSDRGAASLSLTPTRVSARWVLSMARTCSNSTALCTVTTGADRYGERTFPG
jgi:hypothetical protein